MIVKSITILTANFYPEDTAIGLYTTQFAKKLTENYQVNVITGFPYYPQWEIYQNYQDKENFVVENLDDIKIYRSKQFVPKVVTIKSRLKMIFSFVKGALKNTKQIHQTDLVICIVPFTFSIIPAIKLAKKNKAKLWIHVQDFEFDLAFESGILSKKNVLTSLFKKTVLIFESYLLNKADVVSSISQQMLAKVKDKSKHQQPYFFPNWIAENHINPDQYQPYSYFEKNKFNILYSGNVGEKQDWELFLKTANILINEPNIQFTIVGNGTYINQLKAKCSNLKNVVFKPLVPYDELNDLLCSADMHFLFQKNEVLDTVMPSKLLGMMASGKPCIISGHPQSEVKKFLNEETGFYLSTPNEKEVVEIILNVFQNQETFKVLGQNARNLVINQFGSERVLDHFLMKLTENI